MCFHDVRINSHQSINGIIVHLALFAVLNGKLQQFDLLRAVFNIPIKDYGLKIVEAWIFGGQSPQAGKAAISVNNPTIRQHHTSLPLIHHLNVTLGLANGIGIALHNELLDYIVVLFALGNIRCLPSVLCFILADPCCNTVVLVIVKQPIQSDFIDRVRLSQAIYCQLAGHCCPFHNVLLQSFFQQVHFYISSK